MSNEFRRLLDDESRAPLRGVLEAGLRDQPSERALDGAARALGIGAAGLAAGRAAAAAGTARALSMSLWAGPAKWGAAGLMIGGLALSPFALSAPPVQPPKVVLRNAPQNRAGPSKSAMALPAPAPVPDPSALVVAAPLAVATTFALQLAGAGSTPKSAPSLPRAAAPAATQLPGGTSASLASSSGAPAAEFQPDLLDTEVAMLDSARTALKHNDPNAALALLDRHSRLSAPSLGAEAVLLRVQALVAAGRPSDARAIARAALGGARAPAYTRRLRKLAGLPE